MLARSMLLASWPRMCARVLPAALSIRWPALSPPSQLRTHTGSSQPGAGQQHQRQFTLEELQQFTDYYKVLSVGKHATLEDVQKAFNILSKTFHPDVQRHAMELPEDAHLDPMRVEFTKLFTAYQVLRTPAKKQAYDRLYAEVQAQIENHNVLHQARRRSRQELARKSFEQLSGPPRSLSTRTLCKTSIGGLPPHLRLRDIVAAIEAVGRTGRIVDMDFAPPKFNRVGRMVVIEFDSDRAAQLFGLAMCDGHFIVLRQKITRMDLKSTNETTPIPANASRVLIIEGPKEAKIMGIDTLRHEFETHSLVRDLGDAEARELVNVGPHDTRAIEFKFTSWRKGAYRARALLCQKYPELKVSYGVDPCAVGEPCVLDEGFMKRIQSS